MMLKQTIFALFVFASLAPLSKAFASFENVAREIGTIAFAAEFCSYKLTEGFNMALNAGRTGQAQARFKLYFDQGYANGQKMSLLGGRNTFCSTSCLAHGPGSPSAQVGRQSFVACR